MNFARCSESSISFLLVPFNDELAILQVAMYGKVLELRKIHFSNKTFGEITRLDHVKQNKVNINSIPFT